MSQRDFNIDDTTATSRPASELEIYDRVIQPTANDDILGKTNLGLGNYTDEAYWQQVRSYRKWLYAHSAFSRTLDNRVIETAKTELAKQAWDAMEPGERREEWTENLAPDDGMEMDRRRWIKAKKDAVWEDLKPDGANLNEQEKSHEALRRKQDAISKHGKGNLGWTPPFGRMVKMRHEASRSIRARLMDNAFGRVTVQKVHESAKKKASGLKGRLGSDNDGREL